MSFKLFLLGLLFFKSKKQEFHETVYADSSPALPNDAPECPTTEPSEEMIRESQRGDLYEE